MDLENNHLLVGFSLVGLRKPLNANLTVFA